MGESYEHPYSRAFTPRIGSPTNWTTDFTIDCCGQAASVGCAGKYTLRSTTQSLTILFSIPLSRDTVFVFRIEPSNYVEASLLRLSNCGGSRRHGFGSGGDGRSDGGMLNEEAGDSRPVSAVGKVL